MSGNERWAHSDMPERRLMVLSMLLGVLLALPAGVMASEPAGELVLPSTTCRGLFMVPVTVGAGAGTTLNLLLDTGSTYTFIDPGAMGRILGREVPADKVVFRDARIGRHDLAFPGTSAAAAGLRQGDLVTAIDGTPVHERGCLDSRAGPEGRREVWSYRRDGVTAEADLIIDVLVP